MVELDALGSVALDPSLNEHEDFTVDRLRASKATPNASHQSGEQKQGQGANDQKSREVDEVLGVQDQGKEVEPPRL